MAIRKHMLLVLPALLAAMGTQNSAFAAEGIELVADFAAGAVRPNIDPPIVGLAVTAQADGMTTQADLASQPEAEETLRRTIFDILAEARGKIGYLPDPAAATELISAAGNAEHSHTGEGGRRTIFDILADARGNPRFLTNEAEPAEDSALAAVIEAPPDLLAPVAHAQVAVVDQPIAEHLADGMTETAAEDSSELFAGDAVPETEVADESCGMCPEPDWQAAAIESQQVASAEPSSLAMIDVMAEAPDSSWFQVQDASPAEDFADPRTTEIPTPAAVMPPDADGWEGQAARPTVFEILAEARGNGRFLVSKAASPEDSATEPVAPQPAQIAAILPGGQDDASSPGAAEAPRQKILEVIAEARNRIGFQPSLAAPLESEAGSGHAFANTARLTIFDILAEARGNPRFLTSDSPTESTQVEAKASAENPAVAAPLPALVGAGQVATAEIGGAAAAVSPAAMVAGRSIETQAPIASSERDDQNPASSISATRYAESAEPRHGLLAEAEIDSEKLGDLRGGFETPGGLRVSFGIERAVVVNGVLQSSTQLHVNDLGGTVAGAQIPANALPVPGMVTVVQNGVNNSMLADLPAAAMATVVQNSLDNQQLQAITRITATVNSAEMMRGVRLQQSLQDAVNRAALAR